MDLVLKLGGFTQGMDRAARETQRSMARIESSIKGAQRGFALFARGLATLGVGFGFGAIVRATAEAEKSLALLENAVANNAGAAGKTTEELAKMATELQHVSTFSDEAIQDAQGLLLTFKSITGVNFDRATQSVLDLATRLGKDLPSAALLVGKALEDPLKGMVQLARAGVVLDAEQKRLIKSLVDAGRSAEAQAIILAELENTYRGAAAAARDNFGGALEGLKHDLGNLLEAKGGLPEATEAINDFAKIVQDPATKEGIDLITAALLKMGSVAVEALSGAARGLRDFSDYLLTFKIIATQGIDIPIDLPAAEVEAELERLEARLEEKRKSYLVLIPTRLQKLETAELERRIAVLKALKIDIPVTFGTAGTAPPPVISEHDLAAIDKYITQAKTAQEIRVEAVNELNRLAKIAPEKFSPEIYMAEIRRIDAEFKKANAQPRTTRRPTDPAPYLREVALDVQRITVGATEQMYRDMDEATQTSMERQLAEWEQFTAQVQALVDAGRISQEEALARNAEKTDEYLQEIEITAERAVVPVQEAIEETSEFAKQAARNMQDAFADFLFDPFASGLDGMLEGLSNTLRQMAAQIVAAQLAEKFHFEDLFSGRGFGGGGAESVLEPIAVTAQRLPEAGGAAALTVAGTTTATALTAAGATSATALTASGATVAAALTTAGAAAAAAIAAAATAGGAAKALGGLTSASGGDLGWLFTDIFGAAKGGPVKGPGTGTSDSIPARLSAGEFVVKAEAVRVPGVQALLERINDGALFRGFASGGYVRPYAAPALPLYLATGGVVERVGGPTGGREPNIIQQSITINAPSGQVSRATEMQITAAAARGAKAADRHNN